MRRAGGACWRRLMRESAGVHACFPCIRKNVIASNNRGPRRARPLPYRDRSGLAGPEKSNLLNGLLPSCGTVAGSGAGVHGSLRENGLTILFLITTVIGSNPPRRIPVPRRPGDGANHCTFEVFRSPAPARAGDRRPARKTGRPGAGNGGRSGAPERRTPRTALRAQRCHRGRSRVPEPGAGVRRRRIAKPRPARPSGDGREPTRPAAGVAFRFPAAWGSCAHFPIVPCLRRARASAGDALQQTGGNATARSQLDLLMSAIGDAYRARRREAGPDPAFSLLRSSLLANPEPHG